MHNGFAKVAATVFSANHIQVHMWPRLLPVPTVSFAIRYLHADAGVMITASHNPSKYNGYKVYGNDGCQITTEAAAEIYSESQLPGNKLPGLVRCYASVTSHQLTQI